MKKLLLVLALALPLLAACGGPKPEVFWNEALRPLAVEFRNLDDQAGSTARGSLVSVIGQMVAVKTKLELLVGADQTPDCAEAGLGSLVHGAGSIVSGFQQFTTIVPGSAYYQDKNDSEATSQIIAGEAAFAAGQEAIQSDCGLAPK